MSDRSSSQYGVRQGDSEARLLFRYVIAEKHALVANVELTAESPDWLVKGFAQLPPALRPTGMTEVSPHLSSRLRVVRSTKRIVFPQTRSLYKALSADAPAKEGLNAHAVLIDELRAQKTRELWDILRYSGASRRQPLHLSITTAGYDRHSICWEQHDYAEKVLEGVIEDPAFFTYISAADDETPPTTGSRPRRRASKTHRRHCGADHGRGSGDGEAVDAVYLVVCVTRSGMRSNHTIQAYLVAIKGFTRWLTSHHKLHRDPLTSIRKPNPQADRRRERRMLLPEEWQRLETTTQCGEVRFGVSGGERVLLYCTAIQTGLRSNELRSLTRGRLNLDATPPYITCKAGSTKNRKDARQYIQPELAVELKSHIATKAPRASVFNMPHESNVARMLRVDLAAARKEWIKEAKDDPQEYAQREESDFLSDKNHDGEWIDFHALRHTCGAWLALAGVHPKVVQQVMRHQSITLTMGTYGHLFPGQEADAVEQMRAMLVVEPPSTRRATGTDDATEMAN